MGANEKAAAALHPEQACACGATHTSILAAIYCAEQIETDDRAARRPAPREDRPARFELGDD
ncbi:hypothetical protein [Microbacterium lacticum]|uniref:hypothetical protein n=1 Tax=Microbacterium lacticum TaxID=33885 RepID=UPI001F594D70|nr:hypothetical protein [Microbacterium lacticum]